MDSEKGNRVFARGGTMCPPLVFGAQKKPGLDRVKGRTVAIRKGNKHQLGLFFLLEACQRNAAW